MIGAAILFAGLLMMVGGALAISHVSPALTLPWILLCAWVAYKALERLNPNE